MSKTRIHIPSPEEALRSIAHRYDIAKKDRERFQPNWSVNERAVYATHGVHDALFNGSDGNSGYPVGDRGVASDASNSSTSRINLPYSFKNLRFIHAQMSANPPSVTTQPATSDQKDKDSAKAADMLVQWAMRQYELSEVFELVSLNTLLYGSGFIKAMWDGTQGEPLALNDDDTIDMSGEFSVTVPSPWDIWFDPDAQRWSEVKWVFQRVMLSYEEACSRYPEHKELFKALTGQKTSQSNSRALEESNYESVELVEYWEKGAPHNGYLGRYALLTAATRQFVEAPRPNPHRFKKKNGIEVAELPFYCLTDVDVPSTVWGKSAVDYAVNLQDTYNRLLSHTFDAIQAAGNVRGVLTGGAEIPEDMSNSNWEVMTTNGAGEFYYVQPPQLMPDINLLEQSMKAGIDDMMGINDAMMGKMERETAGFALQYAANQGHLIRRRLFNKYQEAVKWTYLTFLNIVKDNWDTERTIQVVGKDNIMESITISGLNISSGFDLIVDYGRSMALDPMMRRQEMLAMMPIFEKAGVPSRVLLKMMHLSELKGVYDMLDLAEQRQREIFEAIIQSNGQIAIAPEEFEDHENMLAYALLYVMKPEFQALDDNIKELIRDHIRKRKQMAGQEKAGASGAMPPQGGLQPLGGGAPGPEAAPPPDAATQELMAILGS